MPAKDKKSAGTGKLSSKKAKSSKSSKKPARSAKQTKSVTASRVTKPKTKTKKATKSTLKPSAGAAKSCTNCASMQTSRSEASVKPESADASSLSPSTPVMQPVNSERLAATGTIGSSTVAPRLGMQAAESGPSILATAISTPEPRIDLAVRSRSSSALHATARGRSSATTPAYLRQLRVAAQTPVPYESLARHGDEEQLPFRDVAVSRQPSHVDAPDRIHSAQPSDRNLVARTAIPAHTQPRIDSQLANVTVTSTAPELVESSADFKEYRVTITCRVPIERGLGAPQVAVTWLLPEPASPVLPNDADEDDDDDDTSDDEPLIRRVAAREANRLAILTKQDHAPAPSKQTTASDEIAGAPETSQISSSGAELQTGYRHEFAKSHTPYARSRASIHRRTTPRRLRTPSAWLPTRRTPSIHSTPAPRPRTPFKSTTVLRKEAWNKAMNNMLSYTERRRLFPRRQAFSSPIKEKGITLPRLEMYWKHMSDLIADRKLLSRKLFEHWEFVDTCTRLVNGRIERLGNAKAFGEEEGRAVLQELRRRRMVWVAGGKVMLSRDALSTRKS